MIEQYCDKIINKKPLVPIWLGQRFFFFYLVNFLKNQFSARSKPSLCLGNKKTVA